MISGAAYVVKALQEENVEILFNYPGAATIDIMDELYKQDQVKVILPRHEQALAHAADGYARSTGKVGVCMVTSAQVRQILLPVLLQPTQIVYLWCVLQAKLIWR